MSKNTSAVDLQKPMSAMRERLTGMLADWGADFSTLLNELEETRALLQEIEAEAASQLDELKATRAELDARKTMIESLRGDAERAQALEAQLKEKRNLISKLEGYIDRHVTTISDLKQSVTTWKEKYTSLKSPDSSSDAATVPALHKLTEEAPRGIDFSVEDPTVIVRRLTNGTDPTSD